MINKKKLCAGLISLGLLAGCYNPYFDPSFRQKVSYEPPRTVEQKEMDETREPVKDEISQEPLEEKIDQVYININKTTEEGVPKLYLRDANTHDEYMKMPVAIGAGKGVYNGEWRNWETPQGDFEIAGIFYKPIWYPVDDDRKGPVKPGRDNPLGDWMLILLNGNYEYDKKDINTWSEADRRMLRIHSTNQPDSIGKRVSRGCIRMHPDKADKVADFLLYNTNYAAESVGKGNPAPDTSDFKSTFRGEYMPFEQAIDVYIRN